LTETGAAAHVERDHSPVPAAIESHDPGTKFAPARARVFRVARMRDSNNLARSHLLGQDLSADYAAMAADEAREAEAEA
jgi:hypothetical protein